MLRTPLAPWILLLAAGGLVAVLWYRGAPGSEGRSPLRPSIPDRRAHPVTPGQLGEVNAMFAATAADLEATDHAGQRMHWRDLSAGKPVVLVFLKAGCPCSAAFEPFVQRLEQRHGETIRLAGVLDAATAEARAHAIRRWFSHPILADPDRAIIRRLGAATGGCVALLRSDGTVAGAWPGCSRDMLRDLHQRITRLVDQPERPLDLSGLPAALTTGCPFDP